MERVYHYGALNLIQPLTVLVGRAWRIHNKLLSYQDKVTCKYICTMLYHNCCRANILIKIFANAKYTTPLSLHMYVLGIYIYACGGYNL